MATLQTQRPLPPGWRWVRLGEVIAEAQPGFACGARNPKGVAQLRMNNVDTRGNMMWKEFIRVPTEESAVNEYQLRSGDVLFNNTNSVELVGKSALFLGFHEPVVYSNHFTRLRAVPEQLDHQYFAAWLLQQWQLKVFENLCNRWIGQSAVKNDKLLALEIPLPPVEEQKRIAAILNEQMATVERARAAAEAQLEASKALPAAYLRAVFSSPEARQWPKRRIGDLAKLQSGYAFKSEWFSREGIRLLRNANVFQGLIDWEEEVRLPWDRRPEFSAFELSKGDVILSLDRPVVADGLKVARLTDRDVPSLLLQRVGRFQLGASIFPDYMYAFLNTREFTDAITRHDQSIGVPHVSPLQVEEVELPLPPLSEQQRIAAMLNEQVASAERARKAIEEELDAINKMPATLLRRAFAGEL
ncbi:MAG: restriction endonuclease subunit S [Terriglobia bacterium]